MCEGVSWLYHVLSLYIDHVALKSFRSVEVNVTVTGLFSNTGSITRIVPLQPGNKITQYVVSISFVYGPFSVTRGMNEFSSSICPDQPARTETFRYL